MKGIVFNLLEEVVTHEAGAEAWDDMLDETELKGAYTSLGSYSDGELSQLVSAASSLLARPAAAVLCWFGRQAMPILVRRYPLFFEGHDGTRSFLLTVNDVIHREVRNVYPGAEVPEFTYADVPGEELVMHYRSRRRLCALAEGFILGAADHFGEKVQVTHRECMLRGEPQCSLQVHVRKRAVITAS